MITVLVVVAAALLYAVRRRAKPKSGRAMARSRKRAAFVLVAAILGMHTVVGSPAAAQQDDTSCAPYPENPGAGMVGAIDPAVGNGLTGNPDVRPPFSDVPYTSKEYPNSPYLDHGYAGMVWHTYDPDCEQPLSMSSPSTTIDTWAGNQLFNVGKNIVGATNSLHYTLLDASDNGGLLGGITGQISRAADAVFDNVYMQLFSLFMLVLAILLFRHIWRGDLATVSKRALFALAGMWLAASTLVLVNNFPIVDRFIVETTTGIQNGFREPDDRRVEDEVLPTELHTRVVYENWMRGEFGDVLAADDREQVNLGRDLLAAKAWRWEDALSDDPDAIEREEQQKREQYVQIYNETGFAQGYMSGRDGSRTGSGFLAVFQSLVYSLFQFLAKLAVLLAQALLRIFTLAAPVIGLVALIHHDVLRKVGRALGAVVLNLLVLSVLAGIHFKFLEMIFGDAVELSMLTQMLLAGIVTLVFLLVGRPMRRMWQMVELSVGATGASLPSRRGLFSRFRRHKGAERGPQDEFWDQVREDDAGDTVAAPGRGRRQRPEAAHPVAATAQRMDTRPAVGAGGPQGLPPARSARLGLELDPARVPTRPGAGSGTAAMSSSVPAPPYRASRRVDTVPVTDRGMDAGEDAMVVPSRVAPRGSVPPEREPMTVRASGSVGRGVTARPADVEMVAGRPVHVVYRPSRGLEVREPRESSPHRRMPLRDDPRSTDSVVR